MKTKTYVCHVCEQCEHGASCHSTVEISADKPGSCLYGVDMTGVEPSKWEETDEIHDLHEINRKLDKVLMCLMEDN